MYFMTINEIESKTIKKSTQHKRLRKIKSGRKSYSVQKLKSSVNKLKLDTEIPENADEVEKSEEKKEIFGENDDSSEIDLDIDDNVKDSLRVNLARKINCTYIILLQDLQRFPRDTLNDLLRLLK